MASREQTYAERFDNGPIGIDCFDALCATVHNGESNLFEMLPDWSDGTPVFPLPRAFDGLSPSMKRLRAKLASGNRRDAWKKAR